MKKFLKSQLNKLPYVKGLYKQVEAYEKNAHYPPGHYYSPIISMDEVRAREQQIWKDESAASIPGVELNLNAQQELLQQLAEYYSDLPFGADKKEGLRYYFENNMYSYTDGIILYSLLRYLKPKRIIEVGSGFSSALMLDVNQHYFENSIELHFIEPNPQRLYANIGDIEKQNVSIKEKMVQDVPPEYYDRLEAGDILFIDSTHVSKTGSDVNYIFFEILPRLKPGVWIHFHDIFYPFEYPKGWVYQGRNWNENYMLRAFLMSNTDYSVRLFPHYLHLQKPDLFKGMPLAFKNLGGNIWIEKLK